MNDTNDNVKDRILYIDILRSVAIFAVIVTHTSIVIKYGYFNVNMNWWWTGSFYTALSRWCVPIMIMISGILLLDPNREYPTKIFLKKRFNKVGIPLIFWSIIYVIWRYRDDILINKYPSLWSTVQNFIGGPVYYHLWFIYTILGLYILTPVLRVYIKNAGRENIKYFLVVWFITNGIINFISKLTNYDFKVGIELYFFTGYVGYYVLGYYLTISDFNKKEKRLLYILSMVCIVATMIGTFILSKTKGTYVDDFNDFLFPNIILMTIGVFVFIKSVDWERIINGYSHINKFILDVSDLSFGIYLVHLLVLEFLQNYCSIDARIINPLVSIPLISMLIMIISYVIIKLMKRLPIIEKFVP
jgi:surface polysaccharide O-acyltransferase-like enzyme